MHSLINLLHCCYSLEMNRIILGENKNTMDCVNVSSRNKEPYFIGIMRFLYESLLNRWFYVPVGSRYLSTKPEFSSFPKGFRLRDRWVYSLLCTGDEFEMRTTDADAILADFFIMPGEGRLKKLLSNVGKPVIISIGIEHAIISRLPDLTQKLEKTGVAGFYARRTLSNITLKKICLESSVPVISAASARSEEIISKINTGVYAICITGKNISKELVRYLHELYPDMPVIASSNRSEKLLFHNLKSGIDAVIFKPCIPFEKDWENNLEGRLENR